MADLTKLRDRLKVALSEAPKEGEPSVSQLANQIKELRESQVVVDMGPQRSESKTVFAEEPVTARIRRERIEFQQDERAGDRVVLKPSCPVQREDNLSRQAFCR